MPKVITVGEILVEMMAKQEGQSFTEPGEFLGPYPSGAPAIFIDQVARMGVDCGIIARVGEDDFAQLNVDRLRCDGVDTSQIMRTPGHTTGTAFVTYFEDGSRKFIFHFSDSAAGMLSSDDIDKDYVEQAEYLHVMGCSLSASVSLSQAIVKAVDIAKSNGAKISFDPNIRPELLQADETKQAFHRILSVTDILLTGGLEALQITGCGNTDEAAEILNRSIPIVILKDGARGCTVYNTDQRYIPPFQVEEIDATGAGDCFDGAFIASLAEGKEVLEAARIASAAGALGVTKQGPMEGASFRADIERLLFS